ncbi:NADPH-dependent FMN reductase [Aquimarina sp. 2201CG14-23]|uniref:NADPH-dependent FMN reductase n=1 Tax=Aquimarina mycalae TaxID=3040073 RepID=UPI002477D4D2|nr:NADPH-dependent FMN reductase [Aquimarina sp. 2201CG14-23]MDH7448104.1 NADPH-dependent FMN reductase [Aquimarina sp. 2201CG14-23]
MKKIIILSGSIRDGRKSHFVAQYLQEKFLETDHINSTLLDLKEYPFPIMEIRMNQTTEPPEKLEEFSSLLSKSDGIIIVSPEYKNGIPGALKNALDYLDPQIFKHIPLGIVTVSSGGFGGLYCLSQLRLVGLALGGIPIPEKLCISKVQEVFDTSGKLTDQSFSEKATQFTNAFLWYVKRLSD